jgi:hypothetical protein
MSLMYCKFTRPDGKMFKVTSGAASQYYNSFTSDLRNGKCSIEVRNSPSLGKKTYVC